MITNSKILTVSYGTFSCTLEGFDDSFGTMKAIAEYFRDLAADDRYFGAEPPTPDAEMLARIAEREISRRVEAREHRGKIVLRAQETPSMGLAQPEETPQPEMTPEPEMASEPDAGSETEAVAVGDVAPEAAQDATESTDHAEGTELVAPTAPATEFTAPQPARQPAPVPVAEETETQSGSDKDASPAPQHQMESARPAPVLTAPAPAPQAEDLAPEELETPEEPETTNTQTDDAEADILDTDDAPAADDDTSEIEYEADDAVEVEESDQPETEPETAETEDADLVEAAAPAADESDPADTDAESVASKLRRIRTVVAQSGEDYGFDEDADDNAQAFLQTTADELEAALAVDDANAATDQDPLAEVDSGEEATAQTVDPEMETAENTAVADAALDDTLAQLLADALPDDADAQSAAPARPLDARVLKVKQDDLQEALDSGQIEDPEESATEENLFSEEDTIVGADAPESDLSPEEEAELRRELAEVEAELGLSPEDKDEDDLDALIGQVDHKGGSGAEANAEPDSVVVSSGTDEETAEMLADTPEDDTGATTDMSPAALPEKGRDTLQRVKRDSELSRIFDETDTQRDEPDSSQRRNAIQHLRAAVAATRAEKKAGGEISRDVDDTPYRSDLATVVRPRRPSSDAAPRSERPMGERPAPLKLVAEQRVDTERQPIQPRRVKTVEPEAASPVAADGGSFAEFIEEVGAGSLAELLEAAAAYMADVEGRPKFSRPMLMGKLKEVEGESFSREDGLRSFGQLLRQGKLQKLNGGHFSITDETDFRAPRRNVG